MGWVLKDAWPKRLGEVSAFLETSAKATPRLVLRIAMEKMTPARRETLLAAARA
jgi:hypothetical protein